MYSLSRFRQLPAYLAVSLLLPLHASAQEPPAVPAEVDRRIAELTALVQKLQSRVDDLEAKLQPAAPVPVAPPVESKPALPATEAAKTAPLDPLRGTTANFAFDGYYSYNSNSPIGRVNLLRAYDVSSNAFSLNQASVVLENPADPGHGKPYGLRLDLQYGQATETLQGNPVNEPRPDVYRAIFQAYGTYVFPVGKGLTVDFGKWASSLGLEGNYTKDQINYSRSFWFNYLPFYHMGARANYKLNDKIALNYWIVNGTNWTEAFNGFKDQLFGVNITPNKNITWTANYYFGQEHPDIVYLPGSTRTDLPVFQGTPFEPVPNPPKGKLHILDSYVTWQASAKLSFALEGDYVIQRLATTSAPNHTLGGASYARYQLNPKLAIAGRWEYLSDRGGLFSGYDQALKESTVTFEQKLAAGLLLREEWRRDASNRPFFLTNTLGILKKEQNTGTLGIVWWFGAKDGSW